MRNKIMTKALAVALSASMAFSLSSAMSLSTAMAATKTAPAFVHDAKFTVVAGGVAKPFKLNKKTRKAGWKIVGTPKVTNTDKATASVTDSKLSVIIIPAESYEFAEGVKKVQTRVKVKVRKNNKKSTQKTLKRKVVLKNPNATEEAAKIKIESAVQTTPTEAVVTLAGEATNDVTIDTFKIVEGEKEYQATAVTLSEDKKSIIVSYPFAESTADVTYTYTFSDANLDGTASITTGSYAVASIELKDQEIEIGSLNPVAFKLLSADGVDVTEFGGYLLDTVCDFEGTYSDANTSSSKLRIQFDNVGDKATVKISYDSDKVTAQATLTAVAATATKAEARFIYDTYMQWKNDKNNDSVEIFTNEDPKYISFYAKATDKSKALGWYPVRYDVVEATSSNENVVSVVSEEDDNNKITTLELTPVAPGSAIITVVGTERKGSQEVKSEPFKLSVKVVEFNNRLVAINTSTSSISLTNAVDSSYGGWFAFEAVNSAGKSVDATYTYTVLDSKGNEVDYLTLNNATMNGQSGQTAARKQMYDSDNPCNAWFKADAAPKGTYRIKITVEGENGSNTVTKEKYVSVKVTDVLSRIAEGNHVSATFKVDGTSEFTLNDDKSDMANDYRLQAFVGGYFVGNVHNWGSIGDYKGNDDGVSNNYASGELGEAILGANHYIYATVTKGSDFYPVRKAVSGDTFAFDLTATPYKKTNVNGKAAVSGDDIAAGTWTGYNVTALNDLATYFGSSNSKNEGIASTGTYTITFYSNDRTGDNWGKLFEKGEMIKGINKKLASKSLTVSNTLTMPDKIDYSLSAAEDAPYANTVSNLFLGEDGSANVGYAGRSAATTQAQYKKGGVKQYENPYTTAKSYLGKAFDVDNWLYLNSPFSRAALTNDGSIESERIEPGSNDTIYATSFEYDIKGQWLGVKDNGDYYITSDKNHELEKRTLRVVSEKTQKIGE